MHARSLTLIILMVAGCDGNDIAPPRIDPPVVQGSAVASNSYNVLSAVVRASVLHADSVAVRYGEQDTPDRVTPAVVPVLDSAVIPVLGLRAETRYTLQAVAYGDGAATQGTPLSFTTGSLPADLPSYAASGVAPSPGYVVFAAGPYGIVIDNTGRVVWYHRFLPNGPGLNFQPQPTGRFVALPPPSDPTQPGEWIEIDVLGNVTRTLGCLRGLRSRLHDLMTEPNGSYWVMCDETRQMDLTATGGVAAARVMGTVIQHVSGAGLLLFEWSAFDHLAITDVEPGERAGVNVNWTHANAFDFDGHGNLFVSFRNLSEITKIDTRTGEVVWRMGGRRNEFNFEGAPALPFARQHGMRITGNDQLILLDNLGDPAGSKARRIAYNDASRSAQLIASYSSAPEVIALLGGTTQQLDQGRALVAFGNGGRVEEYDATGRVVWRIEGNPGYIFRAQRITSLYAPGVGTRR